MIMAGGNLSAVYSSGSIRAWFDAGANFLMGWKPYYYTMSMYVDIGASYRASVLGVSHTFNVHAGANLTLMGPDFSGTATVDLAFISFTINFGSGRPSPDPISWSSFQSSFLPGNVNDLLSIHIKAGLLKKISSQSQPSQTISVLDPDHFSIQLESLLPVKAMSGSSAIPSFACPAFGIGSMGISDNSTITSTFTISITNNGTDASSDFSYKVYTKNLPTALWGTQLSPSIDSAAFIEDVPVGLALTPAKPPVPGQTQEIEKSILSEESEKGSPFCWNAADGYQNTSATDATDRATLAQGLGVNSKRDELY